MATYLENLETRRAAVATELAALAITKAGGLPNSTAGGVDHQGYKDSLYKELAELDKIIAQARIENDGAWEEYTPVYP